MGGNCNLELQLVPTSNAAGADAHSPNSSSSGSERESTGSSEHLTIFYSGRVCVCDLIEIKVRAILCLAKREMDQRLAKGSADPWQQQQLQPRAPALSMKRSLQRFLQKRNSRIQETAPYGQ